MKKLIPQPVEEYPGEERDLLDALRVLREWVRDVQGEKRPLYQLVDQALELGDVGFMRVAIEAWHHLPERERGRILRNSNLTIH